uniref:Uncharacterized protein n=1 Tax=Rhizophora mucronata TaxID=61149 RepID=A0A2P2N291_RHIMU
MHDALNSSIFMYKTDSDELANAKKNFLNIASCKIQSHA